MRTPLSDNPVSRIRVRYTKTGKLRFCSAIDLGRVWERALRRAKIPIAYSEGFSPHPKVSFTDALQLGLSSTGEYAELTFAAPVALSATIAGLNQALPDGIEVLDAVPVAEGDPRFSKWLLASCWALQYADEVDPDVLSAAADSLSTADRALVPRERKGEITEVDLRPVLHQICVNGRTVRAVLLHSDVAMRPSELHSALAARASSPGGELPEPVLVSRIAQGQPTDEGLIEALSSELIAVAASEQFS